MATASKNGVQNRVAAVGPVSNGAEETLSLLLPYRVEVTLSGTCDLLMHAYNVESVAEKAASKKGSKAKKSDDVESYAYRNPEGRLCIPGINLCGSIQTAAKYQQDPRSPRKSARDLFRASVVPLCDGDLGVDKWDYEHKARVVIQRNAVTRVRPAMKSGWKASFVLMVTMPEYVSPQLLNDTIAMAGKVEGLCDFRPTYGRFQIVEFKVLTD